MMNEWSSIQTDLIASVGPAEPSSQRLLGLKPSDAKMGHCRVVLFVSSLLPTLTHSEAEINKNTFSVHEGERDRERQRERYTPQ